MNDKSTHELLEIAARCRLRVENRKREYDDALRISQRKRLELEEAAKIYEPIRVEVLRRLKNESPADA